MSTKLTPSEKVFKAIAAHPGMSRVDYAKTTRLDKFVVGRAFQTLKVEGVIKQKGDRRGASYTISATKAAAAKMEELGLTVEVRTVAKKAAPAPKPEPAKKVAPRAKKATPKTKKEAAAPETQPESSEA